MLKQSVQMDVISAKIETLKTEGLVLGLYEGQEMDSSLLKSIDSEARGLITSLLGRGEITGESKEFHILHLPGSQLTKIIVLGLGKRDKFSQETLRNVVAKGVRTARKLNQTEVTIALDVFQLDPTVLGICSAEGIIMGLDRFEVYKSKKKTDKDKLTKVNLVVGDTHIASVSAGVNRGKILAEGNCLTRDIANHPGNKMTPTILANEAKKVADALGLEYRVMDEPELIAKGYVGITAVSQGSEENCKMVIMDFKGRPNSSDIDLALVGKGLTFDTGGISIKPADRMHMMKYDMCGGAGIVGAAYIIGKLKPRVNVRFYIPTSENMPDGKAYKPGDVLQYKNGKTVEIVNTDAEGRLILADALIMAVEDGAKRIIDAATLTGAVTVCLGHVRTGLFCKDEGLKKLVLEASEECDEKVWELPLDDEFKVMLKSSTADMVNSGARGAGSTTAALFLNEFTADVPFCHLDIAGTAWIENLPTQYSFKSYLPKEGATGTVARTFALAAEKVAKLLE